MNARPVPAGLRSAVLFMLLACLCAPPAVAQVAAGTPAVGAPAAEPQVPRPRAGLMWQRSDLPAVFPLQLKTPSGADYYLALSREADGVAVMAAYVRGGEFFRVLVPPGRYRLRLASGNGWQGEPRLFGPQTQPIDLPQVLEFAVQGASVKAGHSITLSRSTTGGGLEAQGAALYICQIASRRMSGPDPVPQIRDRAGDGHAAGFRLRGDGQGLTLLNWHWRPGALAGVAPPEQRPPLQDQSLLDIPKPLDWLGLPPSSPLWQLRQPRQRERGQTLRFRVRSLPCG